MSDDGTTRDESGVGGVRQTGGWEYVGPDGKVYSVRFVADENGFQPIGDHLVQIPYNPMTWGAGRGKGDVGRGGRGKGVPP